MKKSLSFMFPLVLCLLLSGCGMQTVDDNKIDGFEYVSTIDCEALKKDIKYMKDGVIITSADEVYAYNVDQKYSNGTNSSKFKESVKIAMIANNKVYELKGKKLRQVDFDTKNMKITKRNPISSLNNVDILRDAGYSLFMSGPKKKEKITSYGIKGSDNVIYSFEMHYSRSKGNKANPFGKTVAKVKNQQKDHTVADGEIILDFLYNRKEEDFIKDYIRTDKSYYEKRITNLEESQEFVDVKSIYEWYKNEALSKIIDNIAYYSDGVLITKDGKVYNKL